MCCRLPAAPPSPQIPEGKPPWQWCGHCEPGKARCRIYAERPQGCRDYNCLWKVQPTFPEELRPDRCKVIWRMTPDGRTAIATTEHPEKLQTAAQQWLVRQFAAVGVSVRAQLP